MTLRSRLLVSYLAFVAALGALGGWNVWYLRALGDLSDRILADNYASVVAAQDMKETLERQDSAALFLLLGARDVAVPQNTTNRARFDAAFARAARNVTEPGEQDVIDAIRIGTGRYYGAFDRFQANPDSRIYFQTLQPLFDRVRGDANHLLQLNQQAMREKADRARAAARRLTTASAYLATLLVVSGAGLALLFSASIVRPLRALTLATRQLAAGDMEAAVPVERRDEVGDLSKSFNQMADALRDLRRSDLGRVVAAQRTTATAIDSLYEPVIVTDPGGAITMANRAAQDMFSRGQSLVGRPVASTDAAGEARIGHAVGTVIETGRPVAADAVGELVRLDVDGTARELRIRATPMNADDGRPLGVVVLLEDITHLRALDRLKSEFIGSAAHELRTPLTSVKMALHLLLEGAVGELTPKQASVVDICRRDTDRLERLMNDLLDLSRLDSGVRPPALVPTDAAALLQTAVESLRWEAEVKGVTVRANTPPSGTMCEADAEQIQRVLANLVTNAVRATDRGGQVVLGASPVNGRIRFSVSDTGRGIPAEYLQSIFEPFVQVPGAPRGSAGLGLTLARRIVRAHGGDVMVQSEPGRGTVFTFDLEAVTA